MKCVKEIISRSKQGITKPFKCKASDGAIYWCKGLQAGVDGLRKEWMGAGVLKALGLPTREFCTLECPVGLAEAWYKEADSFGAEARNDFVDNDVNIVFGSLHIESAIDLMSRSDVIKDFSDDMVARIFYADQIIRNTDRTRENSNILLTFEESAKLYLIDHGNAFNDHYMVQDFKEDHIFADRMKAIPEEIKKTAFNEVASNVSDDLINQLWEKMPACWTMRPKRTYAISREDIMQIVSFERRQYV